MWQFAGQHEGGALDGVLEEASIAAARKDDERLPPLHLLLQQQVMANERLLWAGIAHVGQRAV